MNNTRANQLPVWVLIIGILLILGISALMLLYTVWQSVQHMQESLQPVTNMTGDLATQVAEMLHPTPTILPDPITVIYQVRSLARLDTIEYSLEKVITAETGQGVLGIFFGDRMIFVAHGTVIAGVDLVKLRPQDMWLENDTLYVRLPDAEIFIATLNNEKSYVFNRETGLLSKGDVNLETEARQAAEKAIAEAAHEEGILTQARQNAESFLYRLFIQIGYKRVVFLEPTPQATLTLVP